MQEHPGGDASVDAAVAVEIGRVYVSLGELTRARTLLSLAVDRVGAVPASSALPARLLLLRGWVNYLSADYAAAEQDYARAAGLIPLIADPVERGIQTGGLEQRRSSLARRTGDLQKAATAIHRAIDLLTRAVGADHLSLGPSWNELGMVERDRGNHAAAIAAYQHAIAIYRARVSGFDSRTIGSEMNLGEIYMFDGEDDKAEEIYERVLEQARKLQGGPSTIIANTLNLLAQIRLDQKRYAEAAEMAADSDDMYVKLMGPKHNYRAFSLVHLGLARLGLHDGPGALAALNEALELRRAAFGDEHKDTANSLWNIGNAEVQLGDPAAGEKHLREALEIRRRVLPAGHVSIPRTRLDLVTALIALHRPEEAASELAEAGEELKAARDTTAADRTTYERLSAALAAHASQASKR